MKSAALIERLRLRSDASEQPESPLDGARHRAALHSAPPSPLGRPQPEQVPPSLASQGTQKLNSASESRKGRWQMRKATLPMTQGSAWSWVCLLASSPLTKVTFLSADTMYTNISWWVICFLPHDDFCRVARVKCNRFVSGKIKMDLWECVCVCVCESRIASLL